VDVEALLLEIVADRTGFPVEILNADMELDTELGIDSIKRVEILSAVRERLGDLPTTDPPRSPHCALSARSPRRCKAGRPSPHNPNNRRSRAD
jgi:hypothetical protein